MKILVVDDDGDQLEIRSLLLTRSGFEAFSAGDRTTAYRLAKKHRPEVAIVDLCLPIIQEGLDLIRDLKALDSNIRVLVLTGSAKRNIENQLDGSLFDHLFVKPASSAALIRTLRSYERVPSKKA
jgi:DNA-binding response OmpR family regulator